MAEITEHSRTCFVALWAMLTLYMILCMGFVVTPDWHRDWDSAIYLLTARSLAGDDGYTYLGQSFFLRPPGFPIFLSWIVSHQSPFNFYRLNLANFVVAMSSLLALYFLLAPRHGRNLALAITLLFGTSPLFVRCLGLLMSEFLFLAIVFVALRVQLGCGKVSRSRVGVSMVSSVLFATAIYVRAAGLVILPFFLATALREKAWTSKLRPMGQIALLLALLLPWRSYTSRQRDSAPTPATQLRNFTYTTALLHVDPGDPFSPYLGVEAWASRLGHNTKQFLQSLGVALLHTPSRGIGGVTGILILTGLLLYTRRRGGSVIEGFVLSYLGVILLYFSFAHRLVLPLVPFCYYYLFCAIGFVGKLGEKRGTKRLGTVFQMLLFMLFLGLNVTYFARNTRVSTREQQARRTETRAGDWIRGYTIEDAKVLYDFAPSLSVLTGREVYSYRFLRRNSFVPQVDFAVFSQSENRLEESLKELAINRWLLPQDERHAETRIYQLRVPENLRVHFLLLEGAGRQGREKDNTNLSATRIEAGSQSVK